MRTEGEHDEHTTANCPSCAQPLPGPVHSHIETDYDTRKPGLGQPTPNSYHIAHASSSKDEKGDDSIMIGRRPSIRSRNSHGSNSKHDHEHESTAGRSIMEFSQVALCIVCGERPQFSKGGKRYPTCGLTCASKLESRGGSGGGSKMMCIMCGIRPKHSPYETCGLTCAAKLKSTGASPDEDLMAHSPDFSGAHQRKVTDLVSSATYSACLMCWKASQESGSDFCGSGCASAAEGCLLEVPQGHVTFQTVSQHFQDTWRTSASSCPEVVRVHRIVEDRKFTESYERYRAEIQTVGCFPDSPGNESRRWHGAARDCELGEFDNDSLCSSLTCQLCSAIQNSFDISNTIYGIHTSDASSRSDRYSESSGRSPRKAMLLTDVVAGREVQLTKDVVPREKVPDYDSVRVVDDSNDRQGSPPDDLIVYTMDAIRPLYLVVYG